MRTTVLHYFHTFFPELEREVEELAAQEKRLTLMLARRGEVDPDSLPKRRASEPPPKADDLEAQIADVKAKIAANVAKRKTGVVRIVLRGLPRGEKNKKGQRNAYRRLLAEHPPREDDTLDATLGYNSDTFGDALIKACILRTENLDGKAVKNQWDKWADDMTDGQWGEIFTACMTLNTEGNPTVFPR